MTNYLTRLNYLHNSFTTSQLKIITSFCRETPEAVHFEIEIKILRILKESNKNIIRLIDIPNYVMDRSDINFPFKDFLFNSEQKYWIYYLHRLIINEHIFGIGDIYFVDGFHTFSTFLIPNNEINEDDNINHNNLIGKDGNNYDNANISLNIINEEEDKNKQIEKEKKWYEIIDLSCSKKLSNKFCPTKTIFDQFLEENKARRNNDLINQLNIICTYNDERNKIRINERNLNIASNVNGTPITPDYYLHETNFEEHQKNYQVFDENVMLH